MRKITWEQQDDGHLTCEVGAVIVGEIRYAQEGEAEGGLGAAMRMMAVVFSNVHLSPLSPAGIYWQATPERGRWSSPKLASSIEEAKAAVEKALEPYLSRSENPHMPVGKKTI